MTAGLLLALVALCALPHQAAAQTEVPNDWSLIPSGLGVGDSFRLIFISSTSRNANPDGIGSYNTFIRNRAAVGHSAIQTYQSQFAVVGCTVDTDARDNTATTYTASDKGVPIYWLDGNKVADDYEDFYDGSWDDEANDKNEAGNNGPDTSNAINYPYTGCDHIGTESFFNNNSRALGTSTVRYGRPNQSGSSNGPLSSSGSSGPVQTRPFYGLSPVFIINPAAPTVSSAAVDGTSLVITFNENLAAAASLANSAFEVKKTPSGGSEQTETLSGSPAISGATVTLTLATAAVSTDTGIKVSYAKPASGSGNKLENAAGREVESFTDQAVTNTTIATDATLSALALEDGDGNAIPLDPTFATGTTSYTASVASDVAEITVDPTVNESNATVAYFDASDVAIPDADGVADGHQVELVAGDNTIKVQVTAQDTTTTQTYTVTVTQAAAVLCDRTAAVQTAILGKISGVSACADVTTAHLAAITGQIDLQRKNIAALAVGDFAGLTSVTRLRLNGNALVSLPTGAFDQLAELSNVHLQDNALASLPAGVFDNSTKLINLYLQNNALASLPAGAFDKPTELEELNLNGNALASLSSGVFDHLTKLDALGLRDNELSALPDDVFEKLTELTTLRLSGNPGSADFVATATAAASPATILTAGGAVTLDAAGSGGAWGANVTYAWALTDPSTGVTVTYDPDAASAMTTATVAGSLTDGSTLTFTLTVTGRGGSYAGTGTADVGVAAASNATGTPAITGTPQVGMTLTAGIGTIADTDVLPAMFPDDYTFQWVRVDSDGTSNPMDIGTDSGTYMPAVADVGKRIRVKVSFTDGGGIDEGPLQSDATADAVVAAKEDCASDRTGADWCTTLTVGTGSTGPFQLYGWGTNISGADLDEPTIELDDGRTWTPSIIRIEHNTVSGFRNVKFILDAYLPLGSVFNLGGTEFTVDEDSTDDELPGNYTWTPPANYAWLAGQEVTVSVKIPPNAPAVGAPVVTGVPQVNHTLTAGIGDIADTGGLPATFPDDYTFQWVRVDSDGTSNPMDIGTGSDTYLPAAADVGKRIRVKVSFTDGGGIDEGRQSDAYPESGYPDPQVAAAQTVCPANNDWCTTMTVEDQIAPGGTTYGYNSDGIGSLDDNDFDQGGTTNTVQQLYIYDTLGTDEFVANFDSGVPDGTALTLGGTVFTTDADSKVSGNARRHIWDVPAGFGWSKGHKVTVSANLPPPLDTATVDGTSLVLTYGEPLDTSSVPAASAYAVKVDGGTGAAPSSVSISGSAVTLTLATAVTSGQTVTVSYTVPASNPVQEASGPDALALTDQAVTNNTGATDAPAVSGLALASTPGSDGTYATGDTIEVAVTFSAAVTVDTAGGTPTLALMIGSTSRNAGYSSSDATKTILTFSYDVVAADSDQDGVSIAADPLALNGGTITSESDGTNAVLSADALADQGEHVVNKVPNIVTDGVVVTSTPVAETDTYGGGETIAFSVTFDSLVVVDTSGGTPRLLFRMGDNQNGYSNKYLAYASGSGTSTLHFEYTVAAGDRDNNGIFMDANRLQQNGGSIRHASTEKDADRTHAAPGQSGEFPAHKVDGSLTTNAAPDFGAATATRSFDETLGNATVATAGNIGDAR